MTADENWEQMELRHRTERVQMLNKLAVKAYRAGLEDSPIPNPLNSGPKIKSIIMEVAEKYGVTPALILSPSRKRVAVQPRREVYARARYAGFSLPVIGHHVGGRDHSTVLYGIRKYEESI